MAVPFALAAAPVTPEKAGKLAGQLLRDGGSRSTTVHMLSAERAVTKAAPELPAYYVFGGDKGGFVILSADDRLTPVIGWSPDGKFQMNAMPANIQAWFDMWQKISDDIASGKLAPSANVAAEWEALEKGRWLVKDGNGKQLTTANWNQGSPYNMFCPAIDGRTCVTGCVATAAAIVMRYFKWPEAGVGELPSYSYKDDNGETRQVEGTTLGHPYDWENMPLNLTDSTPYEQQAEVARLISDVGIMVQASYNPGGTGAFTGDVYPGLVDHFHYDASALFHFRAFYTDEEWKSMLCNNIENVGPILYSASSKEGGHAFVLDGYSSSGMFHINWGWGGHDNGDYVVPAFDEYVNNHAATINLKKDEGGKTADLLYIDSNGDAEASGLSTETTEFRPNEPFKVTVQYLFNFSARVFDGEIALAIKHADGSMGEIVARDSIKIHSYSGYALIYDNCVIEGEISIGDKICLWYSSKNNPEWTPVNANIEDGDVGEISIADATSIEEVTSFRYTSSSGELVVSTKADVEWVLKDSAGTPQTEGVTFEEGALTIDTRQFVKGSWFLTLTKGLDTKTVEFVFGSK